MTYVVLIIGGIVGGVVRYLFDCIVPSTFPVATMLINLSGSLILGALYGIVDIRGMKPWFRVGFGTGVIGAFTTFSTFSLEMTDLASTDLASAAIYGVCSMMGGPLLAFFGTQFVVVVSHRVIKTSEEVSA